MRLWRVGRKLSVSIQSHHCSDGLAADQLEEKRKRGLNPTTTQLVPTESFTTLAVCMG